MSGTGRRMLGVACLLAAAWTLPLAAQEAKADADVDRSGGNDTQEPASAPAESPEVFLPSEEISEDFAVPFPVDI